MLRYIVYLIKKRGFQIEICDVTLNEIFWLLIDGFLFGFEREI